VADILELFGEDLRLHVQQAMQASTQFPPIQPQGE
jgi:hypothetical protein